MSAKLTRLALGPLVDRNAYEPGAPVAARRDRPLQTAVYILQRQWVWVARLGPKLFSRGVSGRVVETNCEEVSCMSGSYLREEREEGVLELDASSQGTGQRLDEEEEGHAVQAEGRLLDREAPELEALFLR